MNFIARSIRNIISKTDLGYEPLLRAEISKSAILHNLKEIQKKTSWQIAPVLKSNAYGHGLTQVAHIIENAKQGKVPFLIVDSFYEALVLRSDGIKTPLLIIGYTPTETVVGNTLKDISFTITSKDQAYEIAANIKHSVSFHIKIDTGMHRQGIRIDELDEVTTDLALNKHIHIDGACSHLADADGSDESFTKLQIERWGIACQKVKHRFPTIRFFHVSNTAGAIFAKTILDLAPLTNTGRLGIGLYGITPLLTENRSKLENLKPALQLFTSISGIKSVYPKEKIGYGCTFTATKEMRVATIPAGYYEGIDRRLSNKGHLEVFDAGAWKKVPIIARVSMNITIIDVTDVPGAQLHSQVRIVSNTAGAGNSFIEMAELIGTIPYELMVKIPQHIRRVVVN